MNYIEFDKSIRNSEWAMTDLHSHSHYELYYLVLGTRSFFLKDRMYKINTPSLIIIPPYTMHKTEGDKFTRYNLNFSTNSLSKYEISVLEKFSLKIITLNDNEVEFFSSLFEQGVNIQETQNEFYMEKLKTLLDYIILKIDEKKITETDTPIKSNALSVSPVVLKMIDYIMRNLDSDLSLDNLSDKFFLSKTSICGQFKLAMNCTIGEYITRLRLNKAKELLTTTKRSIEEISNVCGFSSPAYLGLVFKQKIGISPLNYRKAQKEKE